MFSNGNSDLEDFPRARILRPAVRRVSHTSRFRNFVRATERERHNNSALIASLITVGLMLLLAWCLFGCAQRYVPAPSAAAVHASITSTQTHIDQASQQNLEARSVAQRIHDKDLLIDRWNETHR